MQSGIPPGPPGGWGRPPLHWGQSPAPPQFIPPVPGHPGFDGRAPDGVMWLKVFCGLQVTFHVLLVLLGVGMSLAMSLSPSTTTSPGDPPPWVVGVFLVVVYLPIAVAYVVGLVGPRRPWMYGYGIFLAVLGFMCGGCWFMAIPFLIFWVKPETKYWYETAPPE